MSRRLASSPHSECTWSLRRHFQSAKSRPKYWNKSPNSVWSLNLMHFTPEDTEIMYNSCGSMSSTHSWSPFRVHFISLRRSLSKCKISSRISIQVTKLGVELELNAVHTRRHQNHVQWMCVHLVGSVVGHSTGTMCTLNQRHGPTFVVHDFTFVGCGLHYVQPLNQVWWFVSIFWTRFCTLSEIKYFSFLHSTLIDHLVISLANECVWMS